MQRPVKRIKDTDCWQRRSEGFNDFFSNNVSTSKPGHSQKTPSEDDKKSSFTPGNIFEKLAFPSEETSQSIAWSSSENEEDQKVCEPKQKRNKLTPRSVPRGHKRTRSSLRQHSKAVEIVNVSGSDTENEIIKGSQDSNTALISSAKSDAASIKGYESDPDLKDTYKRERTPSPSLESDCQSSFNISAPSSQEQNTGAGVKASDWVKSLQIKTPSKTEPVSHLSHVEDSAKKRKKHPRGGLAEQLTRLQKRDQSSIRVWKHQHTSVSSSQDARSVCMEVTGFECLYSLQLVRCRMTDPTTNIGCIDRLVMLPASQAEQLKLQPGMQLKIYPPWQQLELNSGKEIMLCTKYCHILEQSESVIDVSVKQPDHCEKLTISAKWNCPCAQDLCTSESLCPAYQFPCVPGYVQDLEDRGEIKVQETDSNSNNLKAATELHPLPSTTNISLVSSESRTIRSHLQTVGLRPISSMKAQSTENNGSFVFDSILESIESVRSKGEKDTSNLCFKGHVHKKSQIGMEDKEFSYHLFVEDVFGTVCMVQLSCRSLQTIGLDEDCIEGRTFQFSGLEIHERITRERDPVLLSVVDRVWSGTLKDKVTSQDSEENSQVSLKTGKPADFCYILKESSATKLELLPCLVDLYSEKERKFLSMTDIVKPHEKCVRCDCIVRIVFLHHDEKKKFLQSAFVIDCTRKVPLCIKFESTNKPCNLALSTVVRRCKLIKDLCILNGEAVIDEYTLILDESDTASLGQYRDVFMSLHKLNVIPQPINKRCLVNDMIQVTGVICEVDEDSAYSWEVCKSCSSDQIQMDHTTGISKCNDCKKTNLDTGVRMKMEVIVLVSTNKMKVKIDLLQSTIESLLPKDEEDEDGYELSSVLHKHLGPLNCLITGIGHSWAFSLKEIQLLN